MKNTLQKIRQQKGLSQLELARRSGVAQPTVHFIESGATKRPKWETVMRLAEALDVDPGLLLLDVEDLTMKDKEELNL